MSDRPDNIVPLTPKALSAMEEFLQEHERELLTILFTDLVDSTQMQSELGNAEAARLVQIHRRIVREELVRHSSREVEWAGDSCLAVFSMPSDGVRFALTMQAAMRKARETEPKLPRVRVGLHLGEIFVHKNQSGASRTEELFGLQVSEASRVMSLARGDQIYMSRPVYDNARSAMKGQAIEGVGEVQWINHGPYILKGSEEQVEVCEAGETGHAPLMQPEANDKCRPASASREVDVITPEIVSPRSVHPRRSLAPMAVVLVLGVLIGVLATAFLLAPEPPAPEPVQRFTIAPDTEELFPVGAPGILAISPDGSRVVFVTGDSPATSRLHVRSLDRRETRPLDGTQGAVGPFFSPDGDWVAFFAGTKLKKISVNGGAALTLADASAGPRGGAWGPDDTIVYAPDANGTLYRIPATGGDPQPLTSLGDIGGPDLDHRWPSFLPDGKGILFTVKRTQDLDQGDITLFSPDTGEYQVLLSGGSNPRYVASGHIVFGYSGTMMAFPFDLETLQRTGPPGPVLNDLTTDSSTGSAAYSVSSDGLMVYASGGSLENETRTLQWMDDKGNSSPFNLPSASYFAPRLSPDGTRVAMEIISLEAGNSDVWIYELDRGTLTRFTFDGTNRFPVWAPDSRGIYFSSDRHGGAPNLYWRPADGSAPAERLTTADEVQVPYDVSRDGAILTYSEINNQGSGIDLRTLPLEADRTPRPFLQTEFREVSPAISPDRRWMAYRSDESGRYEIYVRPYPGPGGKWQVSRDGGHDPVWSGDGTRIFYRNGTRMMGVSVTTGDTFSARTPEVLFEGQYYDQAGRHWDVNADGSRFLMIVRPDSEGGEFSTPEFRVITNWFTELEQLVPTGGK